MACPSQIPTANTVSAGTPDFKVLGALLPLGQPPVCLKIILVLEVWATEISLERPIPVSPVSRDSGLLMPTLTTLIIGEVSGELFYRFQF